MGNYVNGLVEGIVRYASVHTPRPKDKMYSKPAMYVVDIINPVVIPTAASPIKTNEDLKKFRITTKTYQFAEDHRDAELDGIPFIKFQSKIPDTDPKTGEPYSEEKIAELTEKRRPRIIDSNGTTISPEILVGNGSRARVKFSIPEDAPAAGRRPQLPSFDAIQVLELVAYEKKGAGLGFDKVEGGYTVGSPAKVPETEVNDGSDPFAALEVPEDLETVVKVTTKKKRAA